MKAGFARIDITPPLGSVLIGYYDPRYADGIITPLEANAVAFSDGENTVAMVALDLLGVRQDTWDDIRYEISKKTGLPYEAIILCCTHTHTGPAVSKGFLFPPDDNYTSILFRKICDAITLAIADMKEATPYVARTQSEELTFIRRFRKTDGSSETNPSNKSNPNDIVGPIGEPDNTVQLIRFEREGAADIAIVNFQTHPDNIGGTKICADYPGFLRQTLESALAGEKDGLGVKTVYFNGAQGDLIGIKRFDTETRTFPSRRKSDTPAHLAKHIGRTLAGLVLRMYTYAEPVESGKVFFKQAIAHCPSSRGTAEDVAIAKEVSRIHNETPAEERSTKLKELGYTMEYPEAVKLIRLEFGPDEFELYVSCVGFGDVAFVTFPGEPFTEIGIQTKAASPFKMTFICHCGNGYEGYFPMQEAFDGSGYEAPSSKFRGGVGETLIETAIELVNEMKNLN